MATPAGTVDFPLADAEGRVISKAPARRGTPTGAHCLHGTSIHYLSRFGEDLANVAVFELPSGDDPVSAGWWRRISLADPALQDAMEHHGLAWFDDTAR